MPVPANIAALSTTPASNSPSGSESPTTADDYMRTIFAFIAQLAAGQNYTGVLPIANGGLGLAAPAQVASAATIDIGAQLSLIVEVSGATGPVTSLGTNYRGPRIVRFLGAPLLTYNATTLMLPGAANLQITAGDVALFVPKTTAGTADGWILAAFQKVGGLPASAGANGDITSLTGLTTPVGLVPSVTGLYKNFQASCSGISANVSLSADEIVLESATNTYLTRRAFTATINTAAAGKNGLSTGTLAASTRYYMYAGFDGASNCGWIDPSATAPTVPTGVTNWSAVGSIYTDATVNKYPFAFKKLNKKVQPVVAAATNVAASPLMASGTAGNISTPTWVAIALAAFAPPTAVEVYGFFDNAGTTMIAPNNSYGAYNSATNPPPVTNFSAVGIIQFRMLPESTNIYWASNAAGNKVYSTGYEDSL